MELNWIELMPNLMFYTLYTKCVHAHTHIHNTHCMVSAMCVFHILYVCSVCILCIVCTHFMYSVRVCTVCILCMVCVVCSVCVIQI